MDGTSPLSWGCHSGKSKAQAQAFLPGSVSNSDDSKDIKKHLDDSHKHYKVLILRYQQQLILFLF